MLKNGITLIALVITIIILLILAGIVLSLTLGKNGIIGKAKRAGTTYEEAKAREKLELVLFDLQTDKVTDVNYNETDYINKRIGKNQMSVNGDIVLVDGWQFQIDRSVPKIGVALGKGEESKKIEIVVNVEDSPDYTKAKVTIEIIYEEEIESVQMNGESMEIPEKTDGKYVLENEILQNGAYTIFVKDTKGEYKTAKVDVSEISEDMDIYTVADLVKFQGRVNKGATYEGRTIRLMNNLDLSSVCYKVDGTPENDKSWEPIGTWVEEKEGELQEFKGTFHGNYHVIDHLYINSTQDFQGLFGYVVEGTITGIVIGEHSVVTGNNYIGGIVGNAHYTIISNCGNHADVTGKERVGGIVGNVNLSDIIASYNKGTVKGLSTTGGITGIVWVTEASKASTVKYCYNVGTIISGPYVGGIIGRSYWTNVYNCYNGKDIQATSTWNNYKIYAGGIVGQFNCSEMKYCYNTATVNNITSRECVGGIVGCNNSNTKNDNFEKGAPLVQFCYSSNNVTSKGVNVGGIVGYNTQNSVVKNSYILNNIVVKSNSTSATKNVGASSAYVGRIVGRAYSTSATYIANVGILPTDTMSMPTVYEVVNGNEENGLNNGDSEYWSKTEYSDETLQTPKLKWESNVK